MKSNLAIFSGKLAGKTSRLLGKGGSNIPGKVARKIDQNLLTKLGKQVENIIFVTGTNGKTTTSNLLAHILEAAGKKVMNNAQGANLITGITTCFIQHSNLSGTIHYDYAVIEVDEGTLPLALKQITHPKMILVNNFFRDQLDRYGEIDLLIEKMKKGIEPINTKLLLNGDDPITVRFSLMEKETVFFGLHKEAYTFEQHQMSDSRYCPTCGKELIYEHVHYGQLGYYDCSCGYKRPTIDYEVTHAKKTDGMAFTIGGKSYHMQLSGIHNVYNALAAITAAKELGVDNEAIQAGLHNYQSDNGRMQKLTIDDQLHVINLAKNHAGFNISLEEVLAGTDDRQIVAYLNDFVSDGIDVSWIWDADFERMAKDHVKRVVCSGVRAHDLAIRCKYAGISEDKIVVMKDKEQAIKDAIAFANEQHMTTYHLPNYTALEPVKKTLMKREKSID